MGNLPRFEGGFCLSGISEQRKAPHHPLVLPDGREAEAVARSFFYFIQAVFVSQMMPSSRVAWVRVPRSAWRQMK